MKLPASILVVDDEPHIRKYVSMIIKSLGSTTIIEAANGNEALSLYQNSRPALVLLDVNMPQTDGIKTLENLKAFDPDCLVVMLTSVANRQTIEQALDLGALNYIRKDTPKAEITAALAQIITERFDNEQTTP